MLGIGRSEGIVRFEGFVLDVRSAELRNPSGKTIRLSEQPLRILIALLERPGELVMREDLRKRLWPNDTIVEFSRYSKIHRDSGAARLSLEHLSSMGTTAGRAYSRETR